VGRRSIATVLAVTAFLAACGGEETLVVGTAEASVDTVVQTVAAAAVLEPVDRVTVTAPAAGQVVSLAVADGDQVEAGDPLFTLRSEDLEAQLEQAEAALEAGTSLGTTGLGAGLTSVGLPADLASAGISLGGSLPGGIDPSLGAGLAGGLDIAPLVGALRAQLDAIIPPVLGALEDQVAGLESALTAISAAAEQTGQATAEALQQVSDQLGGQLPEELGIDPEVLELPDADEVLVPVDTSGLEASLADARSQLQEAQDQYAAASAQLAAVEHDAAQSAAEQARALEEAQAAAEQAQAEAAEAQAAAEELQREQAEAAVQAIRDRLDALAVTAPMAGTVELARGGEGGAPGALPGGGDLSALAGQFGAGDLGGLDALAGDLGGGTSAPTGSGPVTVGAEVGAAQPVLTLFDLGAFTAEAEIDELDIVSVEEGQPAVVLLDAFPAAELEAVVERVGIEPGRSGAGGAAYPVSVRLTELTGDLGLRIGMTASVEVEVLRSEGELVVPSSALLRRSSDEEVVHVVADGRVRRVPVEVLAIGDGTAAVAGDLEAGDQVATTGVQLLEDGQEVLVEGQDAAAPALPA